MVKILDCTIRDGGHETNWGFSSEFVYNLIKDLNIKKINYIEIGYRNFYDRTGKGNFFYCTPELLKDFYHSKGDLQFGIMTDTSRFLIDDFKDANKDFCDFVRIATHPDRISNTLNIAYELKQRGYNIFIQLMEIPNLNNEHYQILEAWTHKNILESLYIADTYSMIKPENMKNYFEKLHSAGYENISFHAHNKSGLALINTLEAIKLGANIIDVSQNGLGGNLDISELIN